MWCAQLSEVLALFQFGFCRQALWSACRCDPVDVTKTNIKLKPGIAFGTGEHATTRMCLQWLQQAHAGQTIIDYGCGSGILSIAACVYGATSVVRSLALQIACCVGDAAHTPADGPEPRVCPCPGVPQAFCSGVICGEVGWQGMRGLVGGCLLCCQRVATLAAAEWRQSCTCATSLWIGNSSRVSI